MLRIWFKLQLPMIRMMIVAGDFVIQPSTSKRQKLQQDNGAVLDTAEVVTDGKQKTLVNTPQKAVVDTNKRKQGRGRAQGSTGRARGSKSTDLTKTTSLPAVSIPNGQLEISNHKDTRRKELFVNGGSLPLEDEVVSLRVKVGNLEAELCKSREVAADHKHRCQQLEKELKEHKNCEELMEPKRTRIISDLLIPVSKA